MYLPFILTLPRSPFSPFSPCCPAEPGVPLPLTTPAPPKKKKKSHLISRKEAVQELRGKLVVSCSCIVSQTRLIKVTSQQSKKLTVLSLLISIKSCVNGTWHFQPDCHQMQTDATVWNQVMLEELGPWPHSAVTENARILRCKQLTIHKLPTADFDPWFTKATDEGNLSGVLWLLDEAAFLLLNMSVG